MKMVQYSPVEERMFYLLAALGGLVLLIGLGAAFYMEHNGHIVTGMNNQIVWGLPHVFAIFLIVAASGVLNIASIGSVFGKTLYKKRALLSGLLCIAMLAAGLFVIMLDLGRADRLVIAMTHFNLTSVFGWNVILYPGMFGIVIIYMWTMMEKRMASFSKYAGLSAFVWRLLLTTGTGSIFGFLVARQSYQSAIVAPMFIVMSFSWGLAVFMIVQRSMFGWQDVKQNQAVCDRMKHLLGTFIAAAFYFFAVYHLTNLYFAKAVSFERFILLDGGVFTVLLWVGYFLMGTVLPLLLIYLPSLSARRNSVLIASSLVVFGAFCQLYVFIIGGQAFPLDMFPGMEVSSSFFDGVVNSYSPKLPEFLLGMGGIALAFLITVVGCRIFDVLPRDDSWEDEDSLKLLKH
jgi:molybdopterin-containing oxidoreductase family membrane subunit